MADFRVNLMKLMVIVIMDNHAHADLRVILLVELMVNDAVLRVNLMATLMI